MNEIFSLKRNPKPTSPIFVSRIPMFDPISRVSSNDIVIHTIKYNGNKITIKRPSLSILDQKVFFTLLKSGEYKGQTEESVEFLYDFSKVKQIVSLNKKEKWKVLAKSLERLSTVMIVIEDDDNTHFSMRRMINSFDIYKEGENNKLKFTVRFSKEFIKLIEITVLFSIPLTVLKQINTIKDPIIYRLLTFFITQTKKQKHELFSVLKRITGKEFSTKKERYKVLKAIKENESILKEYGIVPVEIKEGKQKTFLLNYSPKKKIGLTIGEIKDE